MKEIPTFHGTRNVITALKTAHPFSLFEARAILSMPPRPNSRGSILVLPSLPRIGYPSVFFLPGFPIQFLYVSLTLPIRPSSTVHPILRVFFTRKVFGEQYKP
jgi:hypothetical protein